MPETAVGTADPAATPLETEGKEKATLDSITKQVEEQNKKLETVLKQNADKDSFISKLQNENKDLRDNIQKVSSTLLGKTEKQKDAILEKHKTILLNKGYDADSVDALLAAVDEISDVKAEKRASEKVVPIVVDTVEELIDSDPEMDKKIIKEFEAEIWEEYNQFKTELTPRKIKSNFKKAYKMVKDKHAEKAKAEGRDAGAEDREKSLKGAGAPPKGKDTKTDDADKAFVDGIEKSGAANSRFI